MDKIQVQTFLQAAVKRYREEMEADTYDGGAFVIEDVLEKIIVENEKELPKDISGWFRVWQAYTTLDCSDTMHDAGWPTDYGDEQFDAFEKLLTSIKGWR